MFVRWSILPLAALALSACSATSSDTPGAGVKDAQSAFAGLAFSVTDYKTSALYYMDFNDPSATAENPAPVKEGIEGRGGDPLVKWVYDALYYFNRSKSPFSVETLEPKANPKISSIEVSVPDAGLGDPHDVLRLSDGKLLLTQWAGSDNKGKLTVYDPETGKALQSVDQTGLDFSGNIAATFHPEVLWSRVVDGVDEIYVAHQSRSSEGPAEGTQALFVFRYADGKLTPVDQDTVAGGVQGIKLNVSNPQLIRGETNNSTLYVVGICQVYEVATCKQSGIDKIDLSAKPAAAQLVVNLSDNEYKGNGPVVWAGGDQYYAMMAKGSVNGIIAGAHVVGLNAATSEVKAVHEFTPADNNGCCGLFADSGTGRLYVGDSGPKGGRFWIYDKPGTGETPLEVSLTDKPYTGSFIPK